ncbi:MAG: sigma-54-dependent Fis family transcriptional regulator [Ignavibacteriae bacterium]|nr:sigma-54-dependent Fis family transcriptional regulator [Ignavibacteriota bacterium]
MSEKPKINILLVEDEEFDVKRVKNTLRYYENRLFVDKVVSNGRAAIEFIKEFPDRFDVVILDYQISGGWKGEELIQKIKECDRFIQIIVITKMTINITDYNFANSLIKSGAFWYCTKFPGNIEDYIYQPTDFILSIFNAFEKKKLEKQKSKSDTRLNKNIESMLETKKIIGESTAMIELRSLIKKYAMSDANIMISGDSGTGKELVAWNIHLNSKRKHENFVPINCGSIPGELLESELFGYQKGSFTGASANKQGLFEIADHGTLFLDEVAELPLSAQVKLLRVIQEGEIEKIGRTNKISVNVRIIAATNKDIINCVSEGKFREDLYYRLNVIPIDVVPLKYRGKDILELFYHFLEYFTDDLEIPMPKLDPEAEEILLNYKWPGNVRELRNVVQRLVLNTQGIITAKDISNPMILRNHRIIKENKNLDSINFDRIVPLKEIEKEFRVKYISYVKSISNSDSSAADKLGLAPSNFYRMCKELGLK